ncbi:DUF3159 domain-containing protein [Sporichthya sp.]|uniref:DUF3159 domain-containing protein n=1 Tax=Sporichthya sp. TaxID=65475 RepID=UPI0018462DEB|nr:DUF3159 domain-containing protein [Sporichthya sp.]MBA3744540.1 DUF3159 domain-containing protein [Sporichthya sp.]
MTEDSTSDHTSAEDTAARPAANVDTVEELVRKQLSTALGGPRGVIEAAVPTAAFTLSYVITDELKTALIIAASLAAVALVVRLVQRSTVQFVMNAAFGIGIGAAFALRAGGGEDKDDGALAYFLPGILYNTAYGAVLLLTVLIRWPLVGFMVGAVTGDPTAWRNDRAMVKLCSRLTLLLAAPCILRVAVQYPLYEAGEVGLLGTAKVAMGWPLQVAALGAMAALLARGRTPLHPSPAAD